MGWYVFCKVCNNSFKYGMNMCDCYNKYENDIAKTIVNNKYYKKMKKIKYCNDVFEDIIFYLNLNNKKYYFNIDLTDGSDQWGFGYKKLSRIDNKTCITILKNYDNKKCVISETNLSDFNCYIDNKFEYDNLDLNELKFKHDVQSFC